MKAMILAAGLGTRLKPITDKIPKALVEVDGVPMLQRVILTLCSQGFDYIVVNVHHFADQIINFLHGKDFGLKIDVSDEREELLDTGGGIVKARNLIFKNDDNPVLAHNVDIISNANLADLMKKARNFSTLLVSERESSRKLIFNDNWHLIGWHNVNTNQYRPSGFIPSNFKNQSLKELSFSGIYAITKQSVDEMKTLLGEGKYSVMDYFLNPNRKLIIKGDKDNALKMVDIGKPATLSQASEFIK